MNLRKIMPLLALALISAIAIPASAATLPITGVIIGGSGVAFTVPLGSPEVGNDSNLSLAVQFAPLGQLTSGSGFAYLFALQLNEVSISAAEAALTPTLNFSVNTPSISLSNVGTATLFPFAAPTNAAFYAISPNTFTLFENQFARILARIVVTETEEPINPSSNGSFDSIGPNGDIDYFWLQYTYEAIPEPGTVALMVLGLAALGLAARRRRQA